ncbi:hypothetical protein M404DRAFT_995115 [Pisolithus tinctorius Marx 270]|uniref:Uncharacterized protein n=1 Tax=Pisolithus tinctorius Marx 270 TaxID=870435 RepID=A0A0C3JN44_PISTI|nr:hypothetical protein M404DRAFT_995115 [Pisolithus tinctorius Marx 270]
MKIPSGSVVPSRRLRLYVSPAAAQRPRIQVHQIQLHGMTAYQMFQTVPRHGSRNLINEYNVATLTSSESPGSR